MISNSNSILFSLALLFSIALHPHCQQSTKSPKTPQEKTVQTAENLDSSCDTVQSVQTLEMVDREIQPYNGDIVLARSWCDQLGENTLIISEKGEYDHGNGRKEIFGYHYVKRDTSHDLLWQMNDYVDGMGCDLGIELIDFFPLISDIDTDGIAETAIYYSLDARCDAVPYPAKLIIHEGIGKQAIRGIRAQYLGPPQSVNNRYRSEQGLPPMSYKDIDRGSSSMDDRIIEHYSVQWDRFIEVETTTQGALPDSLVRRLD